MFLFKKSKNKILRIGLNLMVYSFPICLLLYFIAPHLNAVYKITSSLLQLSFTSLCIGFIMAFVGFFFLSETTSKNGNNIIDKRVVMQRNTKKDCIILEEGYDGGFTEFHLELYYENSEFVVREKSYNYNAGQTKLLKEITIPRRINSFNKVVEFIAKSRSSFKWCKVTVDELMKSDILRSFIEEKLRSTNQLHDNCNLCGVGSDSCLIKEFNGKKYCYECEAYYSSKFNIVGGKLIDKETGGELLKEVVLCKKPLSSCRGKAEPTDFIFSIFTTKVEIKWGVGWRGGSSHADGAGNTEILERDYFETHTINDFVSWMESKGWGKDFVKWLDVANNPKITSLFTSACQATVSGQEKMIAEHQCNLNKIDCKHDNDEKCFAQQKELLEAILFMSEYLISRGYDVETSFVRMSIVKHKDDPYNHFNKFIAKKDGVYNFIERSMGLNVLTKRLSCVDLETSSFVILAHFVLREISKEKQPTDNSKKIIEVISKYIDNVLINVSDCDMGQFLIDGIIEGIIKFNNQ